DSKFAMVNIGTVLYQCAKFHNFPTSGSMGCHRLKSGRRRRKPTDTIGAFAPSVLGP
ncbi:hypothetical protein M9458_039569, partial [Cirrhinus mrigala]